MSKYKMSGEILKVFRDELNATQKEIGELTGYDSQYVSNWERGLCMPTPKAMQKILQVIEDVLGKKRRTFAEAQLMHRWGEDQKNIFVKRFLKE